MSYACPACRTSGAEVFFHALAQPVHCNRLWTSRRGALDAPRANIDLAFCAGCGLVFNAAFEPALVEYDGGYENALHFSPRFQAYEDALAERLTQAYELRGATVVELGCGDGHFLRNLASRGPNRALGFDPSYRADDNLSPLPSGERVRERGYDAPSSNSGRESAYEHSVEILPEPFSRRHLGLDVHFLCCRHVLEHVADPLAFLREVRLALGHGPVPVYFEVPNCLYMLQEHAFWDVIYEHNTYFTPTAMSRLFGEAGFAPRAVYEGYERQFLSIEAIASDAEGGEDARRYDLEALSEHIEAFAAAYRRTLDCWGDRLTRWRWEMRRVALWGAGSKGVSFLNAVDSANAIQDVVDLNPRKAGMFVAGSGHRIVQPEEEIAGLRQDGIVV